MSAFDQYSFPTRYTDEDYRVMVAGLIPRGIIWGIEKIQYAITWLDTVTGGDADYQDITTGDEIIQDSVDGGYSGSKLGLLLSCLSSELARVEADAWEVLNSTDPGVTTGTVLEHWERVLGLPGECAPTGLTEDDRQRAAHTKLFESAGTVTAARYVAVAESLGFTATIEQTPEAYQPAVCGVARCGVHRYGGGLHGNSTLRLTVTSGTGNIDLLECAMTDIKPAHVIVVVVDERV